MTTEPEQKPGSGAPNDEENDEILSMRFGGKTIRENLEAAIAAGRVVRRGDGKLSLPQIPPEVKFSNNKPFERDCSFLNSFLFKQIYDRTCVPIGCSACYKIKVETGTMRQMMAVRKIAEGVEYRAKSLPEADRPDNQSLYSSYFYLTGLDQARAVFGDVRAKIDADPALGSSVKAVIKRGCTNYEHACGPSDRYTFDPRLKDVEAYFRERYVRPERVSMPAEKYRDATTLLEIARIAYRIGDNTYKDFTDGKEVFPATVSYDPNGSDEKNSSS